MSQTSTVTPLSHTLLWYSRHGPFAPLRHSAFRKFCRHNRGRQWVISTLPGFQMRCQIGDSVDNRIFINREYEPETTAQLKTLWNHCDGFVDIGCNIGYFTCLFKSLYPEKKAWAIDPNPDMIARTRTQLSLNQFQNVFLHEAAVGDRETHADLHIPHDRHSLASLAYRPDRTESGCQTLRVRVRPLESILGETNSQHLNIKIDAEGFEPVILNSLSSPLIERVHSILFEFSSLNLSRSGSDPQQLLEFPGHEDFQVYVVDPSGIHFLRTKNELDNLTEASIVLSKVRLL